MPFGTGSQPSSLPPSGAAGGDLTGTYPNPTIGAGKVVAADIAAGAAASNLGAAGGDLSGTYPSPTIGASKVTAAKMSSGAAAAATVATADGSGGVAYSALPFALADTYESFGAVAGTSRGTVVTAAGSTNTKGAWTQLTAATGAAAIGLVLTIGFSSGSGTSTYLIDIGTGAGGSETVLIPNLIFALGGFANMKSTPVIWLPVPAGTRIAARCQSSVASNACFVSGVLLGGAAASAAFSTCTAYGVNTSTSAGTVVDPGASANTKGAWTEIVASSSAAINDLLLAITNNHTSHPTGYYLFDIGTGAGGSEVALVSNVSYYTDGNSHDVEAMYIQRLPPGGITAGTRVAVRCQSSNSTAGTRAVQASVYGLS